MLIGTIGAVLNGATLPLILVVWTDVIDKFTDFETLCKYIILFFFEGVGTFDTANLT